MTRLLATGDLHLGCGTAYATDRLADQEQILDRIADLAIDRNVDAVLLAGDIFHQPKPTPEVLHVFSRFCARLERAAIPAVAVLGDIRHDQLAVITPTALELFARGDWMRVSRHPELIKLTDDTYVCTLPAVPVHRLVTVTGRGEDVNAIAAAMLYETAAELRGEVPAGARAVLLGHWAVEGAALPNGLPVENFGKPMLSVDGLEQLGFDVVVLGDIHRPQLLGNAGLYVGSPGCWDFGESSYEHGVWILGDLSAHGQMEAEFVPIADRPFVTVDADLTDGLIFELDRVGRATIDETDAIAARISDKLPLTDAVVRIRYRATDEQHRRVDAAALKGFCLDAGAHKVFQIVPEIVRASRARVEGVDETLDERTALDSWCTANTLDELQRRSAHALLDRLMQAVTS